MMGEGKRAGKTKGPESIGALLAELVVAASEEATCPFSLRGPSSLQLSWLRSSSIDSPLTSNLCDLLKDRSVIHI